VCCVPGPGRPLLAPCVHCAAVRALCRSACIVPQCVHCATVRALCRSACIVPQCVHCAAVRALCRSVCIVPQCVHCAAVRALCRSACTVPQCVRCAAVRALCRSACIVPQCVRCAGRVEVIVVAGVAAAAVVVAAVVVVVIVMGGGRRCGPPPFRALCALRPVFPCAVHTACMHVRVRVQVRAGRDLPDAVLRDMVTARLGRTNGASFADIAATAESVGRPSLAALLLDYEPRIADQVCEFRVLLCTLCGAVRTLGEPCTPQRSTCYPCGCTRACSSRCRCC
jgi:hypothetical protein